MDAERPLSRKPITSNSSSTSPNTAFKRKPIPVVVAPLTPANVLHTIDEHTCPHCGAHPAQKKQEQEVNALRNDTFAEDAQRRISELEAEVKILTGKATAAADKLADYEDELQKLKIARARSPSPKPPSNDSADNLTTLHEEDEDAISSLPPAPPPPLSQPSRPAGGLGRALTTTRITNFLAARRNSPASQFNSSMSPNSEAISTPTSEPDLAARLAEAENARKAAETKLTQTNQELEELSASLFQSANEMVADERRKNAEREVEAEHKAKEREEQWQEWQRQVKENDRAAATRAKRLEDKVKKLEQRVHVLEDRDKEKAKRLERLEMAMKRAARIRSVLQNTIPPEPE